MQDLVSRFTLDSATAFLFGKDVRSLSAGLAYPADAPLHTTEEHPSTRFVNAFLTAQTLVALRTRYGPSWQLMDFWRDSVSPYRKVVDEFVEPLLEEALRNNGLDAGQRVSEKAQKGGELEMEGSTLLDHLVHETQDRQVIKDQLTNLLVAGRDTTAAALTFAVYMLTQHPDITARLRAEIASKVGSGRPTYEQIKEMKYLRAFINDPLEVGSLVPVVQDY
ncbi:hypothetical protein H0H81_002174 [Sphagnurus paluster]|uniref:Cytochrome P450 n=1 Tax=Sphagnurus paluster TaxID=117069 RepID=A0A9P7KIH3_9AGAR|nr:hypothetical protein H0H81_002174 [Sphagnurus paluster]